MKKILFLLLFPCFALAQYQGNANQKITLGEQTTADGLVWRGVLNDTALITPLSDTSAYIILDTINNKFYNYNRATNVWSVAGGGTAVTSITGGTGLTGGTITSTGTLAADTNFLVTRFDTSSMLTNYYRAGRNTIIQAADVPTLNQNTTGSAATLTTGRTIQTNLASTSAATFNGSANITPGVTGTLLVANGGTGADMSSLPNNYLIRKNSSGVFDTAAIFEAGGNVGIGTASPTLKLEVNGGIKSSYYQFNNAVPGTSADQGFFDYSNGYARFFSIGKSSTANTKGGFVIRLTDANGASVEALIIYPDHTAKFVSSIEATTGIFTAVGALGGNSAALYRNSDGFLSTTSSDINKKHNVRPLTYGLNTINQLNPVNFQWNVDGSEDIGFIAQDIENIIPESIDTDWDSNLIFKYEKLIPILTKAIQEQNALIKALEQRILTLENK